MRIKMKYKIIKKSEYEFLKHMRVSQGNSIEILDNELNHKTAENVMLQVEIAHAREDVRKMHDKLSDAEIGIEALRRELVVVKAANERLRKELGYE